MITVQFPAQFQVQQRFLRTLGKALSQHYAAPAIEPAPDEFIALLERADSIRTPQAPLL